MTGYQQPDDAMAEMLEDNRLWHATDGQTGSPAYAAFEQHQGLNLRNAVLVSATLQEADFSRCLLDHAIFIDALANGIVLEGARLNQADFRKAALQEADFAGSDATAALFRKANLYGASFRGACLKAADFSFAECSGADFRDALLCQAVLVGTKICGTNLASSDLSGAVFERTLIDEHTNLAGAIGIERSVIRSINYFGKIELGDAARARLSAMAAASR